MKRFIYIALFLTAITLPAAAQSRSNTLSRPCSGSTTPAKVQIARGGNISITPCTGGTVTITGHTPTVASYLTTTVTYNNVDVLADTPLSVSVAASGIYEIDLIIHASTVAQSLKLDFAGTATITNFVGQWVTYDSTDPTTATGDRVTAAGTDAPAPIGSGNTFHSFKGTVEVNAAGTFLLRGAQATAAASNSQILRGSYLKLTKLN